MSAPIFHGPQDTLESLTESVAALARLQGRIEAAVGHLKIGVATLGSRVERYTFDSLRGQPGEDVGIEGDEALIQDAQPGADSSNIGLDGAHAIRELGETLAEFEQRGIPLRVRDAAAAKDSGGVSKQVLGSGGTHEITVSITVRPVKEEGGEA